MKRSLLIGVALLLGGLAGTSGPALAGADKTVPLWFRADITIAADGNVSKLQWRNGDKIPKPLKDRLALVVRDWQFQPGSLDGEPAETQTMLTLRLDASALADGSIGLALVGASTGAFSSRSVPPEYPTTPLRFGASAKLRLMVAIDAHGKVSAEVVDYVGSERSKRFREDFEASAIAAVAQWQVQQERVGGHAVATRLSIPITYCLSDDDWCERHALPAPAGATAATAQADQPVALDSVAKLLSDVRASKI